MKALAPWIGEREVAPVPSSDRDTEWTREHLQQAEAALVAVHVTNLRGVYLPDTMTVDGRRVAVGKDYYRTFRDLPPLVSIGYSINVYRNPWYREPGAAGAAR